MKQADNLKQNMGGPLMAVDALGRLIPDAAGGVPTPKGNRLVGLFYFLWLGGKHAPYDVSKIVASDPEIGYKLDSPLWGPFGTYHHWGEPFYGYYHSNDEWVVRRHIKLFMQADIDFLFFDVTNAAIYRDNALLVMRILQEYHDAGYRVPKVMFYTNTYSGKTARKIYDEIYSQNLYPDTWFCMNGKPVIIAKPEECDAETADFFNIKLAQWPNEPDKVGGWPWMDFTRPQRVFVDADGNPETINVSVAQHPQLRFGDSVLYGETRNRGRAFHNGENDPTPDAWKHGYNFAEQFDRAIETDPPIVLVTGWNEWIAGRWDSKRPERRISFVDCANYEYSRDIEMMRGGYFDNFFMQLVSYVRRYKGVSASPVYPMGRVAVYDGYPDGEMARHAEGYGTVYENFTQRNAIRRVEVSHDEKMIHFQITTKDPVTQPAEGSWMQIFLNTEKTVGYHYILNHTAADGMTTLGRVKKAGESLAAEDMTNAQIPYELDGNTLRVSVPRTLIGIDHPGFTLWFKVADSTETYTAIEDFYDKGDALPLGRLNFVYRGE